MKKFYERALPSEGVYCASGIDRSGKITNRFTESLDELFDIIEDLKEQKLNVFVAPGTFNDYSRKASNSHSLQSFFIDMDVGRGKGYPSKEAAADDLQKFIETVGLPPPVKIDSGTGIHAYWLFDSPVPYLEWKPYAEKFKTLCLEHMRIDPVVTADAARIMRCPETLNYKSKPPRPTFVIDLDYYQYDFSLFREFLGKIPDAVASILEQVPKGLDEDTRKMLKFDNYESVFAIIAQRSVDNEDGCNQIKYAIENAETLPEPMWHSLLSIVRHCADWEECIHEVSKPYPGYTPQETLAKANETLNKPHSCSTFEERNPGGCKNCKFLGKITNPLALGKHLKSEPPLPTGTVPLPVNNLIPKFPDFLRPYSRGVHGGIYMTPTPVIDKEGNKHQDDPILLSAHDIFPIKRMFSPTDGECLLMRYILPNDPVREFTMPMKSVYTQEEFKKLMTSNGVLFHPLVTQHMMNYVIKWGQYLLNADSAEQMRMQMGWTENHDAFVIGKTEITSDGETRKAASSPLVNSIAKLLKAEGDYGLWKKAANALNTEGFELHAFSILCAFGSPLMRMTSTNGVSVCYIGGSGHGKTGALFAGMSVMGNPYELTLTGTRQTTDNGMVGWFLALKNIMFAVDEASNKTSEEISHLVHRIAQGKAKVRMQASVNAVRELEQSASLIAVLTSNQSLYDKLGMYKQSPDGEMARLVELVLPMPRLMLTNPARGREIFNTFKENYGHAGPEFIKYFFKVGEPYVKKLIDKWGKRFINDFGHDVTYRFYENLVSVTFAGGELAKEAGIINYDLDRMYEVVVNNMISIKNDSTYKINMEGMDYTSLVGEFINKHHAGFLILNEDRVTSEPRGQASLVGRIEVHNQMQYISKTEFKRFLAELQVNLREFESALKALGIMVSSNKKIRLSTGWKAGVSTAAVAVYGFKSELPEDLAHGG